MASMLLAPWAIVMRGGTVPGNRPATRIALLTEKKPDGSYRGHVKSKARGAKLSKTKVHIAAHSVVARFEAEPSPQECRQASKALAVR